MDLQRLTTFEHIGIKFVKGWMVLQILNVYNIHPQG